MLTMTISGVLRIGALTNTNSPQSTAMMSLRKLLTQDTNRSC